MSFNFQGMPYTTRQRCIIMHLPSVCVRVEWGGYSYGEVIRLKSALIRRFIRYSRLT